jgi:hypothetical protein
MVDINTTAKQAKAMPSPPNGSVPGASGDILAMPPLQGFVSADESNRLRDLLAFAMAVEGGQPLAPAGVEAMRREADAALSAHAFRILHNRVEEIRQDAVREQMARLRPPPGFVKLILANLVALLLLAGGAVAAWRHFGAALLPMLGI